MGIEQEQDRYYRAGCGIEGRLVRQACSSNRLVGLLTCWLLHRALHNTDSRQAGPLVWRKRQALTGGVSLAPVVALMAAGQAGKSPELSNCTVVLCEAASLSTDNDTRRDDVFSGGFLVCEL